MTKKMAAFGLLATFHWAEHLAQAYQVWILGVPRHMAGGLLGSAFPWLMHSEWLHWGFAVAMFLGMGLLAEDDREFPWLARVTYPDGRTKTWYPGRGLWTMAFCLQGWHLLEHTILLEQALQGLAPESLIQVFFPRIELHLFYNTLVTLPMVAGLMVRKGYRP